MEFVRLRVSGFKSFCEVTELEIGPGLTGIVGPNGCGKSNVVEALRWVMGESSAKGLRGGEMEDVIFGGSAMRPPFDLAEVALGLKRPPVQDTDASIHVLPHSEDLEITRRIGRGTGSLYRLNGREVRARDVQLLFADAGSGAKSPSIVGQGQVGFIVEAKPEERRRLLEEAAGIGGMHSRRHEAELKLRATLANLERVTDQLGLLASRREALEKQARDAERYRKLQAQIRALDAFLVKARITAGRAALAAAGELLSETRTTLGEHRALAETAAAAHAAAAAALPALRDKAAVAAALLARLAERHERLAEAAAQKRAALERLVGDRDETAARLEALIGAIEAGAARQATIVASRAELDERRAKLAAEAETIGPDAEAARGTRQHIEAELQAAVAEETTVERRLEADRARHDERHGRLRAVQTELERLGEIADDALVDAAERKQQAAEAAARTAAEAVAAADERCLAARQPLGELRDKLARATALVQDETKRLAGLEATHERRQAAQSALVERRAWYARAIEQLANDAERLEAERRANDSATPPVAPSAAELAAMQARSVELDASIEWAEREVAEARAALDATKAAVSAAAAEQLEFEAEAKALASLADPVEAIPVLDALTIEPGLETALVAALGDDLMAGTDETTPAFWRGSAATAPALPALPAGATPLAGFVAGVPELARRLAQVGVVADAATAASLQVSLAPGQRLVTREGGLWRWDGFVRAIEADDALRTRLARRQRAEAVAARLGELRARRAVLDAAAAQAAEATGAVASASEALGAERTALLARIEREGLAAEAARAQAERRASEDERIAAALDRIGSERAEHAAALAEVEAALEETATQQLDDAIEQARSAVASAEREVAAAQAAQQAGEQALKQAEAAQVAAVAAERQATQEALAARLLAERRVAEATLRKAHRQDAASGLTTEAALLAEALEALDASIETDRAALAEARTRCQALQARAADASATAERLQARSVAVTAELASVAERLRALDEEAAHLAADRERRAAEKQAAADRLAALAAEHDRQAAELADGRSDGLARELAAAEAASTEAAGLLQAAERELEQLEVERRRAEARLAEAREAVALAEADVERQRQGQGELERETMRRLGQPIEAVLEAVAETEIGEALRNEPPAVLESRLDKLKASRERLGAVNLRAAIECEDLAREIERLESEAGELEAAVDRLQRAIATLNREARSRLEDVFEDVDRHFRHLFQRLFGGGKAHLRLTNMDDPLNAGLELEAMPPGKKLQNIRLLSGGEKSLTALALVFAFFLTQPSPLCVLDEVDAALDDANVERFADLLEEMAKETRTRFLVVTHHPLTMARMHRLFGVTMAERGVSKLVSVAFDEAERLKESA